VRLVGDLPRDYRYVVLLDVPGHLPRRFRSVGESVEADHRAGARCGCKLEVVIEAHASSAANQPLLALKARPVIAGELVDPFRRNVSGLPVVDIGDSAA
jgi:hypothetical protein